MPTPGSYPFVLYDVFVVPIEAEDCTKAKALSDWLFWTQTDPAAAATAARDQAVIASSVPVWQHLSLAAITGMLCQGNPVSSYLNCVDPKGSLCSDGQGVCISGTCECSAGFSGTYCEITDSSSSSTSVGVIIGAVLGSVIPTLIILLMIISLIAIVSSALARRRQGKDDWEIETSELEMAELLGTGGYGEVYRAKWRGTEVAVKMMSAKGTLLTKDMQRNFAEEVRSSDTINS